MVDDGGVPRSRRTGSTPAVDDGGVPRSGRTGSTPAVGDGGVPRSGRTGSTPAVDDGGVRSRRSGARPAIDGSWAAEVADRGEPRSRRTGGHPTVDREGRPNSRVSGRRFPAADHPVDDRFHPSGPLPAVEPAGWFAQVRARSGPDGGPAALGRVGLHLGLAALPLLAISAQVFGVMEMRTALAWLIVPAVIVVACLAMFAPHPVDRVLTAGLVWGVVGCVLYDLFRLDTVYVLGWWGDFIPSMGSWVSGGTPGAWDGALVGYLWRYIGDGGGIGITFFVVAAAVGLDRYRRRDVVLAAVAFAVFPVWAGLIGTVALAPRGQQMLFPLTPVTITLSLVGHLIFGIVMGLGFWRSRHVVSGWPWPAVELPWPAQPASRRSSPSSSQVRPVANSASRSWS
ncbi:hypothetical protein EV378_4386 [Pseudonocardia endophytica]|uniref:Uncharacterized protein n=2 Tax=Pseudonocardia endophytica TaxID=401976 RepID=A0A4R1HEA7_PSEEN|nr:hypothetical protein EV378_4386 [Pseudonocardia endophytica]